MPIDYQKIDKDSYSVGKLDSQLISSSKITIEKTNIEFENAKPAELDTLAESNEIKTIDTLPQPKICEPCIETCNNAVEAKLIDKKKHKRSKTMFDHFLIKKHKKV